MGKHGPCCHCGVTSTPLWRNGPPEKPILCNACGSRWRTKGSLTNYTPMHARELLGSVEVKVSKVRSVQFKTKEQKLQKKNQTDGLVEIEREMPYCDQNFKKILEEDTSNRSSSGSAISFTEHFGTTEASDFTGSVQSNVWESLVPSKKRTCIARPKPSAVEKLTKDLYSIWHEQQSSYLSGSSEEDLLYESETPFGSDEIGHGGVLIRNPNSKITEEESEASSISTDNKLYFLNEAYSGLASFPMHSQNKVTSSSHVIRPQKSTVQILEDHAKRDKPSDEILQIVRNKESPLRSTDLRDVLSFEVFMTHLTREEQQKLMRYLPPIDTTNLPESLKSLFCGSQFVETCSYYQQLLAEGVFDLSFVGVDVEECRILKRLVLLDLTKAKWVERYKGLKEIKCKTKKEEVGGIETMKEPCLSGYSSMTPLKRLSDNQSNKIQEMKGAMRSPKRVCKSNGTNFSSGKPPLKNHGSISKAGPNMDEFVDNEASCFNVRNIFVSPADRSSMLGSLQFTDDIDSSVSDQDLLLDAPTNAPMMEAELLCQPWKLKT
ncbi:GATA transcription factor 26-like [Dioscorea cayenensis subsp. rotundata]|uniref:GATA transcription factor 26-like n=1 Tax=Dioscorea cayennensis subsp. rotundata TaxID=55577 RepID=A0AB40B628_DIOCR|nr:GATA transcription factor 26-like [Dioscorea cayenensis subsp. rotundata]